MGLSNITSAAGYHLRAGVSCTIAHATYPVPTDFANDLYGAARTPPFSVGAAQYDGVCTP